MAGSRGLRDRSCEERHVTFIANAGPNFAKVDLGGEERTILRIGTGNLRKRLGIESRFGSKPWVPGARCARLQAPFPQGKPAGDSRPIPQCGLAAMAALAASTTLA